MVPDQGFLLLSRVGLKSKVAEKNAHFISKTQVKPKKLLNIRWGYKANLAPFKQDADQPRFSQFFQYLCGLRGLLPDRQSATNYRKNPCGSAEKWGRVGKGWDRTACPTFGSKFASFFFGAKQSLKNLKFIDIVVE